MLLILIFLFLTFSLWLFLKLFHEDSPKLLRQIDLIILDSKVYKISKYFLFGTFFIYSISFFYGIIIKADTDYSLINEGISYDIERYYNEKTSVVQDFIRMTNQFCNLSDLAFSSYFTSIFEFFDNSILNTNDDDYQYNEFLRLGFSTRGGFWGSLNNIILYSAYPFGKLLPWVFFFSTIIVLRIKKFKTSSQKMLIFSRDVISNIRAFSFSKLDINIVIFFLLLALILFLSNIS
jgi:hypothetical protein